MSRSGKPTLLLVTPYLAAANNGNWRTAVRWARLLSPHYHVIVQAAGDAISGGRKDSAVAMVALHARRSHPAIAAFRNRHADRALLVALTGTDLYRDLPAGDRAAALSLELADRLIVLQEDALRHLPESMRAKANVVFQSARALVPWPAKRQDVLHCLMVAHLREEKDPATVLAAWRALPRAAAATLTIIGEALDDRLGDAARAAAAADPRIRWLGPRAHAYTRQAIKRAHALLVPSRMEGGANVVVEAITCGTPVVASRMSGNVGMLSDGYPGYFAVGDADGLARLVMRCLASGKFLAELARHCNARAPLFTPDAEAHCLANAVAAACKHRNRMTA